MAAGNLGKFMGGEGAASMLKGLKQLCKVIAFKYVYFSGGRSLFRTLRSLPTERGGSNFTHTPPHHTPRQGGGK